MYGSTKCYCVHISGYRSSLTFETNFTILNFTSEFNLALIQCAQTFPGTLRKFNLGFPGKMKYSIFHHILFMY